MRKFSRTSSTKSKTNVDSSKNVTDIERNSINDQPRYKYRKRSFKKLNKGILISPITEGNRVVSSVPYPEMKILTEEDIYSNNNKPQISLIMEHFRKEGRINDKAILRILSDVNDILKDEKNLLEIKEPINICGDIHGQYYDLIKLFHIGGMPPKKRYLFLGDYVDRGSFGLEVILLLLIMKINYPESIYLLRGNHESRRMTEVFTFRRELKIKSNLLVYDSFMRTFDLLPLSALVGKDLLCMHGGISPQIPYLNDINEINRFREPPSYGPMCDLLWSDPLPDYNNDLNKPLYRINTTRRCSVYFTYEACTQFLNRNKLLSVVRAHEVKEEGYEFYKETKDTESPSVITIFSAPGYLDIYKNKGCICIYDNKTINIKQFNLSSHPYWLPDFMDSINYSIPFIIEQSIKFWMAILRLCDYNTIDDDDLDEYTIKLLRKDKHKKLITLCKNTDKLTNKREELERIVDLKGLSTKEIIGSKAKKKIDKNIVKNIAKGNADFQQIQKIDSFNEKNPATANDDDDDDGDETYDNYDEKASGDFDKKRIKKNDKFTKLSKYRSLNKF